MTGIVKYFLNNSIAGNLLMVFILMAGGFGLMNITSTFFPQVENKIINIQIVYPGSSPEEVEEGVISRIEENLLSVTGIEQITSISSENTGSITVEVLREYDTDEVLQDVKNAVDRISSFPANMEPPVIYKLPTLSNAITIAVYGEADLKSLKNFAETIEDELLQSPNISQIELGGFPEQEIQISFSENALQSYNLTFDEALQAVRSANIDRTGGSIKTVREEFLVRAKNKEYYARDLADIVIRRNPDGGVIYLHQIAELEDRWQEIPTRNFVNGKPAVIIDIQNTTEEDVLDIAKEVRSYVQDFNDSHSVIQMEIIRDGAQYLQSRMDFLKENGLLGMFLVLILLAMFLNWRLAFWVALSIPISFAGMFMIASLVGVTINVISLFGMIIVIGILVDDGIVIAENIFQKYEEGLSAKEAAEQGVLEVMPAVFSAILTTIIAFSSFYFIEGRLGDIFFEMATVVILSLAFSLVEGLFILPAHVAHSAALQVSSKKPNVITQSLYDFMDFLRDRLYQPVLRFAIKFAYPIVAICLASLFIVIGAFRGGFVRGTFFPFIPRDDFTISLELPAGTNVSETYHVLDSLERSIAEVNDKLSKEYFGGDLQVIEKVQKNIGPGTYQGSLRVFMLKGEFRENLPNSKITNAIRSQMGPIPSAEKYTFGGGNVFGDPISVSLLGKNKSELREAVSDLKIKLATIPDLKDISDSDKEGLKEISLELTPLAYNLGFTVSDIIGYVRQGFFGAEVQRLQRGSDEVKVWVRYGIEDRNNVADLENMHIRTNSGQAVKLSELATFKIQRGIIAINHLNAQREIRVNADVVNEKVSVSDITADIKDVIVPNILDKYPSVRASYEGQGRENERSVASMKIVMPIVFLLMFFVVILTFNSVSQALLVFAVLPFGLVGVVVGHYIIDLPISMFSILGVIALIGIIINDSLVFVSTFNEKIRKGFRLKEAIEATGKSRFRPILLTTVTTIAGLGPLILEKSLQAQFLIPMAVSVAFGLLFGTFILLALLPALLIIVNRIRLTAMEAWVGRELSPESVEPANPNRRHNWVLSFFGMVVTLAVFFLFVFITFKLVSVLN